MSMAKANSQVFCRTILLLSFVAFAISLETLTKRDKYVSRGEDKKDRSSAELLEQGEKRVKKVPGGGGGGYIYLITMRDPPHGYKNLVKIGRSSNPWRRIQNLRSGNPFGLVLNKNDTYQVTDMKKAERLAHRAMKGYHFNLEWYRVPRRYGLNKVHQIVSTAISPYMG